GPSTGNLSNGVPNVAHLIAKARTGRVNSNRQDADDLDRLLAELRGLWEAATNVEPPRRSRLHGKIVQAIEKLKKQIGEELTAEHRARTSSPLFRGQSPDEMKPIAALPSPSQNPRSPAEPVLRLYDKDLADQALVALPQASHFSNVEEFREHLA